jgi:hypothetical protein
MSENREASYRLKIHSIPTLVIFNDGEKTRRFFGLQKADSLTRAQGAGERFGFSVTRKASFTEQFLFAVAKGVVVDV